MTSAARRALRRGRTRRSPRMSCSPMTARSGVSKPCSRPSTARRRDAGAGRASAREFSILRRLQAMLGQQRRQPLARARRPGGDDDAAACLCRRVTCATTASKTLASASLALGREGAAGAAPRTGTHVRRCRARSNGVRRSALARWQQRPSRLGLEDEHALGRNRLVGRRAEARRLQRVACAPRSAR